MKAGKLTVYLFLLFCHPSFSQQHTPFQTAFSYQGSSLGIFAEYNLNSNSLTHDFVQRFYKGGFINTEVKDKVSSMLLRENRIGGDLNYGLYYVHLPDTLWGKSQFGSYFSLRDRNHLDMKFSDDFFKLVFYGNSRFEEKTADINNFNLNVLRYQQMQFGVIWTGLDSLGKLGASISVLNGNYNYFIHAKKAELFTGKDGHYIDLNTSFNARSSDTSNMNYLANNGYGFSSELFFEAPYKTNRLKGKLNISLTDIGFIRWNDRSLVAKVDSTYHYEGIEIKSIFDLQDSVFASSNPDSLRNALIKFDKKLFTSIIPATLHITTTTQYGRFNFIKGFRYIFNAGYKPYYYLGGEYTWADIFVMALNVGYGGYGKLNLGMGLQFHAGKYFTIQAGSSNMEGFLLPESFSGQGLFINLQQRF